MAGENTSKTKPGSGKTNAAAVTSPKPAKPSVAKAPSATVAAARGALKPVVPTATLRTAAPAPAKTSALLPKPAAPRTPRAVAKPTAIAVKTAPVQPKKVKAVINTAPVSAEIPSIPSPSAQKEPIMDMTSSYKTGIEDVLTDAQDKAKEVFEKGSSLLGEAGEFARGNVEAFVESGKILASGLQDMGSSLAAEGRSAFETMTADLKELAAAKTPADFLKVQSELVRKSFDGAVAYGSKNSEAVLKLATDTFAPISSRVSLAVEKARTAV